jgi:hypothetical protein
MTWHKQSFFPDKYRNFYGCALVVAFHNVSVTLTSQTIFEILAEHLNFQQIRKTVKDFSDPKEVENIDFIEDLNVQSISSLEASDVYSSALYSDYVTFTVPAGEPYTQLEKMFLMFDEPTWTCIGLTLAAAFLIIQVINFMSIQIQKFVFGLEVRTPTLNLADILLNGGQNRVPGRNFARFMLMMFVIWTLIIRTCYQSALYKNLQDDMRRPIIQSIDELNEKNFTLLYLKQDENFTEILDKRQV